MGENAHKMGIGNDENDENRVEQHQFLLAACTSCYNQLSFIGGKASKDAKQASKINQRRKKDRFLGLTLPLIKEFADIA